MKESIPLFLCRLFSASFISCNDGDDNDRKTVEVKVTGSANAEIANVQAEFEDGKTESFTDIDNVPWSVFYTYHGTISVSVAGRTTNGAEVQLTLQVIHNGKVVKEDRASGVAPIAVATY